MRPRLLVSGIVFLVGGAAAIGAAAHAQETEPAEPAVPTTTDSPVDRGLDWLARHQMSDGRWSSSEFVTRCDDADDGCSEGEGTLGDLETTSLALLAFLGAGESHKTGPHAENVVAALKWMSRQQRESGRFGVDDTSRAFARHCIATRAFVVLYGLTGSRLAKTRAVPAVAFVANSQRDSGAWGDDADDAALTGEALFVLRLARMAELDVGDGVVAKGLAWLAARTDPESGAFDAAGAHDPLGADATTSAAATALLARIWLRDRQTVLADTTIEPSADWLLARVLPLPEAAAESSAYDWWMATHALHQIGGERWDRWRTSVLPTLHAAQQVDGCARGSAPPESAVRAVAGRVGATALACLTEEACYAFSRVLDAE